MTSETIKDELMALLPRIILRADIPKYLGQLISPRYLANLDSAGQGPPRFKIGKKVAYLRELFVDWYLERYLILT